MIPAKSTEEAIRFYRAAGFDEDALNRYRERFGGFGYSPAAQAYGRLQQDDTLAMAIICGGWKSARPCAGTCLPVLAELGV